LAVLALIVLAWFAYSTWSGPDPTAGNSLHVPAEVDLGEQAFGDEVTVTISVRNPTRRSITVLGVAPT
jgi:hypothetical protein